MTSCYESHQQWNAAPSSKSCRVEDSRNCYRPMFGQLKYFGTLTLFQRCCHWGSSESELTERSKLAKHFSISIHRYFLESFCEETHLGYITNAMWVRILLSPCDLCTLAHLGVKWAHQAFETRLHLLGYIPMVLPLQFYLDSNAFEKRRLKLIGFYEGLPEFIFSLYMNFYS